MRRVKMTEIQVQQPQRQRSLHIRDAYMSAHPMNLLTELP